MISVMERNRILQLEQLVSLMIEALSEARQIISDNLGTEIHSIETALEKAKEL